MWRRPIEVNAPSLTYQLWLNGKPIRIDNKATMNEYFYYTLKNLESFTAYEIRVIAQTRNSSKPSERIMLRTKIGMPSQMNQPKLEDMKNRNLKLKWIPPIHLGGNLDFYQLMVTHPDKSRAYYQISGHKNSCIVDLGDKINQEIFFYIRGVNVDENKKISILDSDLCFNFKDKNPDEKYYYGEWSAPIVHLSFYTGLLNSIYSSSLAISITICLLVSLLTVFSYMIVKLYHKILKISDIKAVYPEGLDPNEPPMFDVHEKSFQGLMDLDLVKSRTLTGIVEEVSGEKGNNCEESEHDCEMLSHSNNNVIVMPLMKKSKTVDASSNLFPFQIDEKCFSNPSISIREDTPRPRGVDMLSTGYTKMFNPRISQKNKNNNKVVSGYLDMTGRSPPTGSTPNFTSFEVKNLIDNTRRNNGYIDRRTIYKSSFPINVNANGYVAFKKS